MKRFYYKTGGFVFQVHCIFQAELYYLVPPCFPPNHASYFFSAKMIKLWQCENMTALPGKFESIFIYLENKTAKHKSEI